MRFAVVLALLLSILPACKGEKGDTGPAGPSGQSGQNPNPQADLLVFEGQVTGSPTNVFVGTIGDRQIVLAYIALSGAPNDWIQLGYPTGDNAVMLDPWFSQNGGTVSIFNGEAGDHYKIFLIPVNMLSSFTGLSRRLID